MLAFFERLNGVIPVISGQHFITTTSQDSRHELAHLGFVIENQDHFARALLLLRGLASGHVFGF